MSKYSKNLSGVNQKVIVSPNVAFTAATTYSGFIDSAAEGEIGVFLDTQAVKTTALTAGQSFFIAQKRDGMINKTPLILWDRLFRKLRTAYDAPVLKQMTVGYAGTTITNIFDFTGASLTNTLTFGVTARDLTPGNQPFPVQEGYATVNSSTADQYSVLATIVSQLNGDLDYERVQPDRFVKAEITSNGTVTALGQTAAVINGSTAVTAGAAVTLADGSFLSLAGAVYKVKGAVTAATAIVLDRPYQGTTATLASGTSSTTAGTIAYTSGTTLLGVKLTALDVVTNFTASGINGLQFAPVTTQTAWKLGAGAGTAIRELEATEGIIFDGVGSTRNVAFREDYGQPTLFSSTALTYDQIFLDFDPIIRPSAAIPAQYGQTQIERVLLATPVGAGTGTTFQTIFGL